MLGVRQSQGSATILSDALQQRSQAEYPIEIDKPVRVLVAPAVGYPPAAAKSKREGTVVAWTAVGAGGEIEDIVIEGDPEFGDAVTQAMGGAKFLPAENDGSPIRFYVVLTFEFRTGASGATPPAAIVAP